MNRKIQHLAKACEETDYGDPASVKCHNEVVTELRGLIRELSDTEAIANLTQRTTKKWVAFQLAEEYSILGTALKQKVREVLIEIASSDSIEARPAQMALDNIDENRS